MTRQNFYLFYNILLDYYSFNYSIYSSLIYLVIYYQFFSNFLIILRNLIYYKNNKEILIKNSHKISIMYINLFPLVDN